MRLLDRPDQESCRVRPARDVTGPAAGAMECSTQHPWVVVQDAWAAVRREDWREALTLWEVVRSRLPNISTGHAGLGRALSELGRFDEAEAVLADAIKRFRQNPGLAVQHASIAMRRRDWEEALVRWAAVRTRFPEIPAGYTEAAAALCRLDRVDEAEAILADAVERFPENPWPAVDHAGVAIRRNDRHAAVGRHWSVLRRFGDRPEARAAVASALTRLAAVPGLEGEAMAQVIELWQTNGTEALIHPILPLLTRALFERCGPVAVLGLLDDIARLPINNGVHFSLGLMALFERLWLDALCGQRAPDEVARLRDFASRLDHWGLQGEVQALLTNLADRFDRLRRQYPNFLVDSYWRRSAAEAVVQRILTAHAERRPFSLIRLGDGDGNFLPYPKIHSDLAVTDRDCIQRYCWGEPRLVGNDMASIMRRVRMAYRNADVVGVTDLWRICCVCCWLPASAPADMYLGGRICRGWMAILDRLEGPEADDEPCFHPDQVLTCTQIHYDLAAWGLHERLFGALAEVVVIAGHPVLAARLAERFGLRVTRSYLIPPAAYGHREGSGYDTTRPHYPDAFHELERRLTVMVPGEVFLVSAGFLGKIYCDWIKRRGGLAIDIGSMADYWCGLSPALVRPARAMSLGRTSRTDAGGYE